MKEENIETLIHLLKSQGTWVKSKEILAHLDISPRTLRNYVNYVNEHYKHLFTIESSNKGYYLKKICSNETIKAENNPFKSRMLFILQKLILKDSVNIFDLSEGLFVSVPTIEKDLTECRKFIKSFNLSLERVKNHLFLKGEEIDKRKIMSEIYSKEYNTTFPE